MTYRQALDYINALAPRGWRLGLDRMHEFAVRAGLLQEGPRFIHIAGTNGKGSTTAYVQSILHESGYRTGAFFSPYVYDPRERIQLGREYIPEAIFAGLATMLEPIAEEFTESEYGGISEFEFKTAMAFLFYQRLKCEWVALEVGLGGRLDATNIISPACSIVVSVGLDHTNILGTTLEEIAHEKAGIIKPGVPVIIGQMPEAARRVVEREAAENGSEAWLFGRDIVVSHDLRDESIVVSTPHGKHAGLKLGIKGSMQDHNLALAVAACDAAGATRTLGALQRGAANATIPGRFEIRNVNGKTLILDGAHNADASQVLVETLRSHPSKRVLLVTGMVGGHDPKAFYRAFEGTADKAFVVPIDFHRSLSTEEVALAVRPFVGSVQEFKSVHEGLRAALHEATAEDVVLVTGSFYLLGEVGHVLETWSEPGS